MMNKTKFYVPSQNNFELSIKKLPCFEQEKFNIE